MTDPELFGHIEFVNGLNKRQSQALVVSENAYIFIIPIKKIISTFPQIRGILESVRNPSYGLMSSKDGKMPFDSDKNLPNLQVSKNKGQAWSFDKNFFKMKLQIHGKNIRDVLIDMSSQELIHKSQHLDIVQTKDQGLIQVTQPKVQEIAQVQRGIRELVFGVNKNTKNNAIVNQSSQQNTDVMKITLKNSPQKIQGPFGGLAQNEHFKKQEQEKVDILKKKLRQVALMKEISKTDKKFLMQVKRNYGKDFSDLTVPKTQKRNLEKVHVSEFFEF